MEINGVERFYWGLSFLFIQIPPLMDFELWGRFYKNKSAISAA